MGVTVRAEERRISSYFTIRVDCDPCG